MLCSLKWFITVDSNNSHIWLDRNISLWNLITHQLSLTRGLWRWRGTTVDVDSSRAAAWYDYKHQPVTVWELNPGEWFTVLSSFNDAELLGEERASSSKATALLKMIEQVTLTANHRGENLTITSVRMDQKPEAHLEDPVIVFLQSSTCTR